MYEFADFSSDFIQSLKMIYFKIQILHFIGAVLRPRENSFGGGALKSFICDTFVCTIYLKITCTLALEFDITFSKKLLFAPQKKMQLFFLNILQQ